MKRWNACVAALVVLGMTGCMRGCNVGPPAKKCKDSSECEDRLSCYRGYCSSQSYIDADQKCRASPDCRDFGACGAITVESFLGADNSLECAAIDEADCRASRGCTESGACTLSNVVCIAASEDTCKKSSRCETHQECKLSKDQCVRPWQECTAEDPLPHQPAWARTEAFDVDMKRLGGKSSPGPLRGAILACEVEPKRIWPSRVFIRDKCMPGPTFAPGVTRLSFARANVSMEPGDAVTVIIEPEGAEAGAKNSSLVRAVYQGESPFQGGSPGESIVCHVVQNDVAKTFGLEALAEAKKHVEAAKPHKPSRDQVQDLPKPLYDARRDLSRAALWIGWDSPDVIKQLDAMTKVERGWSKALDKMFRELEKKTPPLTDAIQLKGKELPSVKPYGLVCGEALRTRYGDRAKGRTIGPDECGLELLFESKADKEVSFSWSFGSIGSVHYPRWLVRSGDGAHVVEAVMIDGRLDESGSKPDLAVIVPPGKRAIILVGGKERDPKLGRDNVEAATLFQGYESFGDWFEMRTDLAR